MINCQVSVSDNRHSSVIATHRRDFLSLVMTKFSVEWAYTNVQAEHAASSCATYECDVCDKALPYSYSVEYVNDHHNFVVTGINYVDMTLVPSRQSDELTCDLTANGCAHMLDGTN